MEIEEKMQVFDGLIALMAYIDENESRSSTLLAIKENLKDYFLNKQRSLSSAMIDSLTKTTVDKEI